MALVVFLFLFCTSILHAHDHAPLKNQSWSFSKLFGTFDRAALQRGLHVFKEVCSTCHSLKRIRYRNLKALGFTEAQIKAIASQYEITDGPDADGKPFQRKALPSDAFPSPFPNDNAARAANNGAVPPDLSLIIKARKNGADYVYSMLTGYDTPPKDLVITTGQHYNTYFPGNLISMAPPLHNNQITYVDGTKATVDQMAHDVVTFLAWASEPELEQRKQTGTKVMIYLLFMTVLFYLTKRRIWRNIH